MITISDHSVEETRVPSKPVVLDVGCRNFGFTKAVLARWPEARIVALDPDPIIKDPGLPNVAYIPMALVHDDRKESGYASYSTGEGNFLTELSAYYDAKMLRVPCITIQRLMEQCGVVHWDMVKLDCEGSEFGILENWPGPIATQLSVEFHDYTDLNRWNDAYYARLFAERLPWYEALKHGLTPIGPGPSYGHWDSVLALRQ